jgi:hypothetical protein
MRRGKASSALGMTAPRGVRTLRRLWPSSPARGAFELRKRNANVTLLRDSGQQERD